MNPATSYLATKALRALERAITVGRLTLKTPDGKTYVFEGEKPGPAGEIVIIDWRTINAALAEGDIGLGNAHMAGWWESSDLEALMAVLMLNVDGLGRLAWGSPFNRIRSVIRERILRRNSISGSKRNIMAHYDLGNAFYSLWLDPSMSYSSAIYKDGATNLEAAQKAKYRRILDRLGSSREEVLEIGCGWGGFIEEAAKENRRVTALTISEQQHAFARARAGSAADVRLEDYRKAGGRFPAIVSIEMFEAVGERYWPTYFKTLRERLTTDGLAVIQTISISEKLFPSYRLSSDYIRHHIFPGGMLPSLSRFRDEAARAGLAARDVFSFGADYARTCREWLQRFDTAAPQIRALGYDDAFMRGWRLYLAMCAAGFSIGRIDVHQIELAPTRN